MRALFFETPAHFRAWLQVNYAEADEILVGFYKKSSGKRSITYPEALDEALCFGWIDGVRRSIAGNAYTIRFTPRRPKSQWSTVNIKKAHRLVDAGRMHASGLEAFAGAGNQPRKYSYEQRNQASFDREQKEQFRAHRAAWDFFQNQPPWYRRTATFWVISAKKEVTRQKRLATLIHDCAQSKPIKPLTRPVPKRQKKT